jgi:hypothetical protein
MPILERVLKITFQIPPHAGVIVDVFTIIFSKKLEFLFEWESRGIHRTFYQSLKDNTAILTRTAGFMGNV